MGRISDALRRLAVETESAGRQSEARALQAANNDAPQASPESLGSRDLPEPADSPTSPHDNVPQSDQQAALAENAGAAKDIAFHDQHTTGDGESAAIIMDAGNIERSVLDSIEWTMATTEELLNVSDVVAECVDCNTLPPVVLDSLPQEEQRQPAGELASDAAPGLYRTNQHESGELDDAPVLELDDDTSGLGDSQRGDGYTPVIEPLAELADDDEPEPLGERLGAASADDTIDNDADEQDGVFNADESDFDVLGAEFTDSEPNGLDAADAFDDISTLEIDPSLFFSAPPSAADEGWPNVVPESPSGKIELPALGQGNAREQSETPQPEAAQPLGTAWPMDVATPTERRPTLDGTSSLDGTTSLAKTRAVEHSPPSDSGLPLDEIAEAEPVIVSARDSMPRVISQPERRALERLADTEQSSALGKALEAILERIESHAHPVVMFVDAEPHRSAASELVLMMGMVLSRRRSGQILMVDAKVERPGLSDALSLSGDGAMEVMLDGEAWEEHVQPTATDRLFLLPAGDVVSASGLVLEQQDCERMDKVLDEWRRQFDAVLIDGATWQTEWLKQLAARIDAVFLVVELGTTLASSAANVIRQLQASAAPFQGCVAIEPLKLGV